jgi:preprotein translocase subunit SecA
MTGTALTEEEEFGAIYKLDIIEVPTNRPLVRRDHPDIVYRSEDGKYRAVIEQIEQCHKNRQPVLVGTVSIEKSEHLSKLLSKRNIPHNVLNAKNHEREAEIIAQAGKLGAVTIATNMAGRGTDIMLGGNAEFMAKNDLKKAGFTDEVIVEATGHADSDDGDILKARAKFAEAYEKHRAVTASEAEEVCSAGGLFILGTERHESRRIDNQLRGRAGRQGDPGESRFYIAMTDDIMRLFGSERILGAMDSLGFDDDTPIDQKILSNAIESAQKKVESRNFQARKNVLEYDDVMNTQRKLIYEQRRRVLDGDDLKASVLSMISDVVASAVSSVDMGGITGSAALDELIAPFEKLFLQKGDITMDMFPDGVSADLLSEILMERARSVYEQREKAFGTAPDAASTPIMRELERVILLRVVDEYWMEHIDAMEELRDGVRLRAYSQTNPVDEYKREGFEMFEAMINGIKDEVVRRVFTVAVRREQPIERRGVTRNINASAANAGGGPVKRKPVKSGAKIGPNDPCPCGKLRPNGLPMKYKNCCGRAAG